MFFIAQIIGIYVSYSYAHQPKGTLPAFLEPPSGTSQQVNLFSILIAILTGTILILILIKFQAATVIRVWFFIVVILAITITLNSFLFPIKNSFVVALFLAVPLAIFKVFFRNIKIHNLTELAIYPGIASLFIPLLTINSVVILLVAISLYDMYAVWHSGIMQKMAKYHINQLKIFPGFFIPYIGSNAGKLENERKETSEKLKRKAIKIKVAILGGGDVIFPIILAGVVLSQFGLFSALIISSGATISLAYLLYNSEKGKFYPAMPFISIGCFLSLIIVYLLN